MSFLNKKILNYTIGRKPAEAKGGKMSMRLTPSGWGFCGLMGCVFLLSINFSNNLIFAMTFLLAGIAMVGGYHTRSNVKGLVLGEWRSTPVFAGQDAVCRLSVGNPKPNPRHGLLAACSEPFQSVEKQLPGGEQTELILKRPAPQRGRLPSVRAHLQSSFPLGIFRAQLVSGSLPSGLVYPAPVGDQPVSDQPVGREAHLRAESGNYTDMRRYAAGDPLSHIHWQALARFDELYTKEFDGAEGLPALWLRWDDVLASETEQKLSQLCRWVLDTHQKNREYGLELPGITLEPAGDEAHQQDCLRELALYGKTERAV
ncbi:MAG: DUF58 domain-containing protein [Pontiella sp.]